MAKPTTIIISQQTADELRTHGVPIPKGARIVQNPATTNPDCVVVRRWTDPPIMPDNIRSSCSICNAITQERPHNPPAKRICHICFQELSTAPRH